MNFCCRKAKNSCLLQKPWFTAFLSRMLRKTQQTRFEDKILRTFANEDKTQVGDLGVEVWFSVTGHLLCKLVRKSWRNFEKEICTDGSGRKRNCAEQFWEPAANKATFQRTWSVYNVSFLAYLAEENCSTVISFLCPPPFFLPAVFSKFSGRRCLVEPFQLLEYHILGEEGG